MKPFNSLIQESNSHFGMFRTKHGFNSQLSPSSTFGKNYPVGIKTLPQQTQSLKSKKGATLNLLLVGQIGLGKTTFINTLFGTKLRASIWDQRHFKPNDEFPNTTSVQAEKMFLVEDGFDLDFTVINTAGFCDGIDNQFSYVPVTEYIDQQLRLYMFQEEQPDRRQLVDNRVHACIFFINPTSKGLSTSDIEALRHISSRVNLIPVIAKADSLTTDELSELKDLVRQVIEAQDIKICEHIEDDEVKTKILGQVPYAIIGCEDLAEKKVKTINDNGEEKYTTTMVIGRKYDWGVAEVWNEDHCDFVKLKQILLANHMIDLISSTESYYERCRDKLLKTRINEAKSKLQEDELIKDFDFEDINKNGLRNYKVLSKFNKTIVDDLVVEWNPIFVQKQLIQRKKFNEIVAFEEKKFKDWKKALFNKQNLLNTEIEGLGNQVRALNEEIQNLMHPASSPPTGEKTAISEEERAPVLDPPGSSSAHAVAAA